ncbi:hypothetical protein [Dokdonella ginsengisoli]|uniref:Uncharacterized protein n=1 Tax=Dokdonella ginsengisoli TaxID=363846 RepID=A0ABV9QYP9_9GAMM
MTAASSNVIQDSDPFELILSHANGVRRLGPNRATFKAPTREDRTASVSLARGADGAVLLHDFGGDSARDILEAMGLSLASLYPQCERRDMTPSERSEMRMHAKIAGWSAALGVLDREATVVLCAAAYPERGEPLAADDQARLSIACQRIHDAREVLNARS